MSVQAIGWALSVTTNSPGSKLVLVTIANYADEQGFCWPSQALIARQSEQSIDSVQRRLRELEKAGFLVRKARKQQSSLYQLLMPTAKKPQIAASTSSMSSTKRHKLLKPQNPFKKPQLCGTEPSLFRPVIREDIKGFEGKKGKPRHGAKTRDSARIWIDKDTDEWRAYEADYRQANSNLPPVEQWNGSGAWFSLLGSTPVPVDRTA